MAAETGLGILGNGDVTNPIRRRGWRFERERGDLGASSAPLVMLRPLLGQIAVVMRMHSSHLLYRLPLGRIVPGVRTP